MVNISISMIFESGHGLILLTLEFEIVPVYIIPGSRKKPSCTHFVKHGYLNINLIKNFFRHLKGSYQSNSLLNLSDD